MTQKNLNEYFFEGFGAGGSEFDGKNPYLWSSSAYEAFECGKYAAKAWSIEKIKLARASRGSSIWVEFFDGSRVLLKINYKTKSINEQARSGLGS